MFDELLLLTDGRAAYFGDASGAVAHFTSLGHHCPESFNPSDYFLDVLSPDNRSPEAEQATTNRIRHIVDTWRSAYEQGLAAKEGVSDADLAGTKEILPIGNTTMSWDRYRANVVLLSWRAFAEQSRDYFAFGLKTFFSIFFALVIGGIYSNIGNSQQSIQNRYGLLFFILINSSFAGVNGVLTSFPKERDIVTRERSAQAYDTVSYYLSKVLVEAPLNLLPSTVYAFIVFWLVGLRYGSFGIFLGVFLFTNFVAILLGLFISAGTSSALAAQAIGTPLIIINLLFGGYYIRVDSLPIVLNWIPYISFFRWGFEVSTS